MKYKKNPTMTLKAKVMDYAGENVFAKKTITIQGQVLNIETNMYEIFDLYNSLPDRLGDMFKLEVEIVEKAQSFRIKTTHYFTIIKNSPDTVADIAKGLGAPSWAIEEIVEQLFKLPKEDNQNDGD